MNTKLSYPETRRVSQTDDYHGVKITDPYRWLEDDNSPETKAWVEAQNKTTFEFLAQIPAREKIKARLTKLWDYAKFSLPTKRGGKYFYSKNDGLQNQYVLFVTEKLNETGRVLLDPNALSKDGTIALSGTAISEDGTKLAYGIADAGSDWQTWHVRDVATGKDTDDLVKWVKFSSASWTKDGSGFFYSRYAEPPAGAALSQQNFNHKIYFHALGDDQSKDVLVYERLDHPDWNMNGRVTEDGKWLVVSASQGTETKNRLFLKPLDKPDAPVAEFLTAGDASYSVADNDGDVFYVVTDKDAPRRKLIAVRSKSASPGAWREIISQADKDVLESVSLFGQTVIATYMQDAHTVVKKFDLTGKRLGDIALPGIGSAGGWGGRRDETETFYSFSGYTTPATSFRYDLKTGQSEVFKKPNVDFNPTDYETRQVFYKSKDGTKIPMFLTHKKGVKRDGANPTYLYGYGGFNASLTPGFSPAALVWMEMGGLYAVANLRGGGEYGEAWHEAGKKSKKQNVFDDFIAAAEFLIKEKYTTPSKLAIAGGSNGGLLVGAVMEQRPELFAAALPAVGVMDMLRFSKFTIGWAWKSDYGDPENADEFKSLLAYSPLHNLKIGTKYPATLVTTSDHDDRVVPAHSFKFAAALQAAQAKNGPPTLIRIETRAGHGAGKPTAKVIEEVADIYGFLTWALEMNTP